MIEQISPLQLSQWIQKQSESKKTVLLIDVREEWEFETAKIKISFSNAIGKIGVTATKLFYPLPGRKEKLVQRFIQLILSIMFYSNKRTAM